MTWSKLKSINEWSQQELYNPPGTRSRPPCTLEARLLSQCATREKKLKYTKNKTSPAVHLQTYSNQVKVLMKLDLQITSEKWKCSVSRPLTVSKLLFPSMLWPPRGWLAWFLLIGVGGPRDALSFRGAEIAAKTTTSDKTFEWVASISKKTNWRDCLALSKYRRTTEIRLAGTQTYCIL